MDSQLEQQLEKIMPEDLARTFESAYHVIQGRHEHMDDLLKHGAVLLRKAARRFTSTQLILGIAAVATVAVVVVSRNMDDDQEGEAHDLGSQKRPKDKGGDNKGGDKARNDANGK